MNGTAALSEAEAAYVLRFCYEVWRQLDGPGTTLIDCRGYYTCHYYDLATLATVSGLQYDERAVPREYQGPDHAGTSEAPPPSIPFPWPNLEALHGRAAELASVSERGRAVFELATPRRDS